MHTLLINNIDWDTDGQRPVEDCNLPRSVLAVNAPYYWDSEEYRDGELSEALSDVYGFCHHGFEVMELIPDSRDGRLNWQLGQHIAVMTAPGVQRCSVPGNLTGDMMKPGTTQLMSEKTADTVISTLCEYLACLRGESVAMPMDGRHKRIARIREALLALGHPDEADEELVPRPALAPGIVTIFSGDTDRRHFLGAVQVEDLHTFNVHAYLAQWLEIEQQPESDSAFITWLIETGKATAAPPVTAEFLEQ